MLHVAASRVVPRRPGCYSCGGAAAIGARRRGKSDGRRKSAASRAVLDGHERERLVGGGALPRRLHPHYPQSGERFRGRAAFIAINAEYPTAGRWSFAVRTIVADVASTTSDIVFANAAGKYRLQSFFELWEG